MEAVQKQPGEDTSKGYGLAAYRPLRETQLAMREFAIHKSEIKTPHMAVGSRPHGNGRIHSSDLRPRSNVQIHRRRIAFTTQQRNFNHDLFLIAQFFLPLGFGLSFVRTGKLFCCILISDNAWLWCRLLLWMT